MESEITSGQGVCGARPGFSKVSWLVVFGPPDRKNSVTIRPAPMMAMTDPRITSQVRTGGGKSDLPIDLRDYRSPSRRE